ncbi:hypothetical protein O1K_11235, partial [Xanthomonas fragariae LMG 25863]
RTHLATARYVLLAALNKDLDMHDTTRSIRTSDLAALAQATDATGQVDLTAYQGYRLMKAHQTLERVM